MVFLDKAMLKLLLNHWQESYHKAPTRVTSEDPLLCTDLAKTRPNEEFLVSRVNPVFVDSSTEGSPSSTIKKPSETTADVHSSQDGDKEVASTSKEPPEPPDSLRGVSEAATTSDESATTSKDTATPSLESAAETAGITVTADTEPKSSEVELNESDFPKDSLETDRSSSPRPLVELREWHDNKPEDRVLNRLRSSGRASVITKEKLNLVEKVIAERLGKRVPEPGIRKTIELLRNESTSSSPQHTLLPTPKRVQTESTSSESPLPVNVPPPEQFATTSSEKQDSPAPPETPSPQALTEETASVVDGSLQAVAAKSPEAPSEAGSSEASRSAPKDESSETVSMPKIEDAHSDSMTDSSNSKKEDGKDAKSSGPSTSEDSGITRGDQVYSDTGRRKVATKSDTSDQSSTEASRGKRQRRIKKDASRDSTRKRQKSAYKSSNTCSHCRKAAKKSSHDKGGHKHKRRSMAAAESGIVASSGSLSDLAFDHPWLSDSCAGHCHHKRSSISCMESCRDYPCEDFHNAVYRYPGGPPGWEGCNCIRAPMPECCRWGDVPRSRYSWNGSEAAAVAGVTGHPICSCRRMHPLFSSRRKVKFAHRSKDPQKTDLKEDEEDAEAASGHASGECNHESAKSDQGSFGEVTLKETQGNGHILVGDAENGLLEKQQQGPPYGWEEWQRYMREKNLRSRRKRALCMGVIALTIILFVGISVSLGLAYLRRKF